MTSIQLAQRALRILTVRDLASVPMDEAALLVDAMNGALATYAGLLPAERRITADSRQVSAPLELSVTMAAGAKVFTYSAGGAAFPAGGYAAEADAIGCSCLLSGDSAVNRLHRAGELYRPYGGGLTSGSLTIYNDAFGFDSGSVSIHGPVRWVSGNHVRNLYPFTTETTLPAPLHTGDPEGYIVENHLNIERDALPMFLLRLWPVPSVAGAVEFRSELRFPALKLADLTTPKSIAVPGQDAPHVTAFMHEGLLLSSLLKKDPTLPQFIVSTAAAARATLTGESAPRHASAHHQVLTPPNY
ncbi:MAG TPA: hypothetical protein VD994_20335 [Prosthecobacter sp.]|nr:hypothetical protein [Prosthecobacter sp.]